MQQTKLYKKTNEIQVFKGYKNNYNLRKYIET